MLYWCQLSDAVADNLLNQNFNPVALNQVWALGDEVENEGDIGYTGHKYDADLALSYM
ncbi:hypothetical protein CAG49_15915 [Vibrio sp. V22_P2S10T140]|nr:hypothetical protein [Vibrio sp. V22_P2S10T140]